MTGSRKLAKLTVKWRLGILVKTQWSIQVGVFPGIPVVLKEEAVAVEQVFCIVRIRLLLCPTLFEWKSQYCL